MYAPPTGRWLSEDPAGYVDGPNQYLYVRNNPVNMTDPSGMQSLEDLLAQLKKMDIAACKAFCKEWVATESKDTSWTKKLPDCPCFSSGISGPEFGPLEKADPAFHPGADECTRSNVGAVENFLTPQPGQQCCYSAGILITTGPGAGTPDKYSPTGVIGVASHFKNDVFPFLIFQKAGMADEYLKARPPNTGGQNKCDEFAPMP